MPTQKILIDDSITTTYYIVSKIWIRVMTVLVIIGITGIFILAFSLYYSRGEIKTALEFNEKMRQRNLATDEMLSNRALVLQWIYIQACDYAKDHGKPCLDNPLWWADPRKYPALLNDSSGSGLFPSSSFDQIKKPKL